MLRNCYAAYRSVLKTTSTDFSLLVLCLISNVARTAAVTDCYRVLSIFNDSLRVKGAMFFYPYSHCNGIIILHSGSGCMIYTCYQSWVYLFICQPEGESI